MLSARQDNAERKRAEEILERLLAGETVEQIAAAYRQEPAGPAPATARDAPTSAARKLIGGGAVGSAPTEIKPGNMLATRLRGQR
jgi:hypothetical protein